MINCTCKAQRGNWMDSRCLQLECTCTNFKFSSVAQSCLTLYDPVDCRTPSFPVHHQLPEPAQTHVHQVGDAIQPSHPLVSSLGLHWASSCVCGQLCVSFDDLGWAASYICSSSRMICVSFTLSFSYYPGVCSCDKGKGPKEWAEIGFLRSVWKCHHVASAVSIG